MVTQLEATVPGAGSWAGPAWLWLGGTMLVGGQGGGGGGGGGGAPGGGGGGGGGGAPPGPGRNWFGP
jgi:hypothetical protein